MEKECMPPRGEIGWVGYYGPGEVLRFMITSKESREWYYLYEVKDGKLVKLGRAKEPPELIEKFKVYEKMRHVAVPVKVAQK